MSNKFRAFATSLIQGTGHRALPSQDLAGPYTVVTLMADGYDAGALTYLLPEDSRAWGEVLAQVRKRSVFYADQLSGKYQF